jgi:hypothetical protein
MREDIRAFQIAVPEGAIPEPKECLERTPALSGLRA